MKTNKKGFRIITAGYALEPVPNTGMKEFSDLKLGEGCPVHPEMLQVLGCSRSALMSRVKKSGSFAVATLDKDPKIKVVVRVR